jgi:hypothetical protein
MSCLRCGSDWRTVKGKNMVSCPECCKTQRCKARKQGRLPQYQPAGRKPRPSRAKESAKRRRLCALLGHFVDDARHGIRAHLSAAKAADSWANNPPRSCVVCGKPFRGDPRNKSATCSFECCKKVVQERSCDACGSPVALKIMGRDSLRKRRGGAVLCRKCVQKRSRKACRRGGGGFKETRKRCRRHDVPFDPAVKPALLFERDGYRCHVCKRKTLPRFVWVKGRPHVRSPTVDHFPYPLSVGVWGHEWRNVKCCCWECNTKKSAWWDKQLPLAVGRD